MFSKGDEVKHNTMSLSKFVIFSRNGVFDVFSILAFFHRDGVNINPCLPSAVPNRMPIRETEYDIDP